MNTFKFVKCLKNDVRVRLMFDKMVFDPSLIRNSRSTKTSKLIKGISQVASSYSDQVTKDRTWKEEKSVKHLSQKFCFTISRI